MPSSNVVFDIDGPVATITLARTEAKNALTWAMYDALVEACDAVPGSGARAVIIRGSGGAFSSGTDIHQFDDVKSGADGIAYERRIGAVIARVEALDVPTIASVDGPAVGGGCAIAIACDLRLASDAASFGVPVARTLGNCLSVENLARLVDLVGSGAATEMMLTGRLVSADQALEWGLVTKVLPVAELETETLALALDLSRRAPSTVVATKAMLRRLRAHRRPAAGACDDLLAACYASADFREGVAAFAARRAPAFS
ncbi:MAG: enoyl-CoA hydratase/isomerase family protein [Acidobacteria bacterium]|nr:enoyl-CoA hydratase/isomerase family protein [Acidobacteriota bacterium]